MQTTEVVWSVADCSTLWLSVTPLWHTHSWQTSSVIMYNVNCCQSQPCWYFSRGYVNMSVWKRFENLKCIILMLGDETVHSYLNCWLLKKNNPQRAYMKQKAYIWNFLMCSLLTIQNRNIMWESLGGKVNYSSIGQYRELHWGSDFVLFFILCLPVNCLVHKRVSNSVAAAETKDCTAVWLWL